MGSDLLKTFIKILIAIMVGMLLSAILVDCGECTDASSQTSCEILSLYIKRSNPKLSYLTRRLIAEEIVHQSSEVGIPWEITAGIIKVESCFDPKAIGPLGEMGLMQIYTMECAGQRFNPEYLEDIKYNISAGLCIFCDKLKLAKGDVFLAIERYNGTGPGARRFRLRVMHAILSIFGLRVSQKRRKMQNAIGVR